MTSYATHYGVSTELQGSEASLECSSKYRAVLKCFVRWRQLGHQAAQCTNGTINWRQLYGDEAFRLKEPLYESELQRMRQTKAVDISALEKRAKEYAAVSFNLKVQFLEGPVTIGSCAL